MTKMDLAPAVQFDWHLAYASIQAVRPGMQVLRLSAKTGDGMDEYVSFLALTRRGSSSLTTEIPQAGQSAAIP
jgi:hydrogenase nickel incorporation protein HypB